MRINRPAVLGWAGLGWGVRLNGDSEVCGLIGRRYWAGQGGAEGTGGMGIRKGRIKRPVVRGFGKLRINRAVVMGRAGRGWGDRQNIRGNR